MRSARATTSSSASAKRRISASSIDQRRQRLDDVHAVAGDLAEDLVALEQRHDEQLRGEPGLRPLDRVPDGAPAPAGRACPARSPTSARGRGRRARSRSGRPAVASARAAARRVARRARRAPRARSPRSVASPAAAAMSLPPKVEPWRTPRSMPSKTRSRTAAETSTPPIGTKPPESALATQIMSGSRPQCSSAKKRPVRPRPVWTSSQTNSAPCLAAGGLCAPAGSRPGARLTPLPWIGSTMNAATSPRASSARSASRSPNGTRLAARQQRPEAVAEVLVAVERQRAEREAVEGVARVEDPRAPGRGAGELDRALDRLGAGVGRDHRGDPLRSARDERLGEGARQQRHAELGEVGGVRVQQLVQLGDHVWVVAADRERAVAATAGRGSGCPRRRSGARPRRATHSRSKPERAHDPPELRVEVAVVELHRVAAAQRDQRLGDRRNGLRRTRAQPTRTALTAHVVTVLHLLLYS